MSVFHEVKEHLSFRENDNNAASGAYVCANTMQGQLAALAGLMLIDEASIYKLQMTADGKEYHFEGDEVTPEYKAILGALNEARDVDLVVEYEYTWRSGWSLYDLLGPFVMMEMLEDPKKDFNLDQVFYSAWYRADGEDGSVLAAYGTKDGKTYTGEVPFEECAEVPSGEWVAQDSPIAALAPKDDNDDLPAFMEACKNFAPFCEENDFSFHEFEGDLEFDLHNATLRTDADVRSFVEKLEKLQLLSTSEFDLLGNFADLTQKDGRVMVIEEGEDGGFVVKVAMV